MAISSAGRGKRFRVFRVMFFTAIFISAIFVQETYSTVKAGLTQEAGFVPKTGSVRVCLNIRDWKTGEIYVSVPVRPGSEMFFGWIHSLEKIPWNEYYHIDGELNFILDSITFPAFGAGIPENKGRVCYVKDGLIHMEEIDEKFEEIVWLNSHTATQDIMIDGKIAAKGDSLPQHTRLRMSVEKSEERGSSNGCK